MLDVLAKRVFIFFLILSFILLTSCHAKKVVINNPAQDQIYDLSDCKPVKVKTKKGETLEFRSGYTHLGLFVATNNDSSHQTFELDEISKITCSKEKDKEVVVKKTKAFWTVTTGMLALVGLGLLITLIVVLTTADMSDN